MTDIGRFPHSVRPVRSALFVPCIDACMLAVGAVGIAVVGKPAAQARNAMLRRRARKLGTKILTDVT